ncbi:sarcosine oxidase subunit gamma family protein [Nocardioides sp. InS609-2]|uniref:sarcosine oxidase subunit gamma family protein n=1 Tax=Nocardioides sp. InS609-2 TaxID=2760705 RepID=UPI0020BD63E7|nr:sarcosine oxidase subunit gamma family protein [Nocardioides sp. InS609-2]
MAETAPLARSSIAPAAPEGVVAGWVVSARVSSAELTLTDLSPLAKVAVRADPLGSMAAALAAPDATTLVTSVVPGEWLVVAGAGAQVEVMEWVESVAAPADGLVSVVDLTHGRALLRLTGRRAADVLAKECAVDLSGRRCPDGRALRTAVSGLAVDVVRDDRDALPSYLMHCERSSGQYLFDALLDAGSEFGIDVDGFRSPGIQPSEGTP